jgi:hypothetical protein
MAHLRSLSRPVASSSKTSVVCSRGAFRVSARPDISCNDSKAKFFVGGNWKSNGTLNSVNDLVKELNGSSRYIPEGIDVVCAPTMLHLDRVNQAINHEKIKVASQNCWYVGMTFTYRGCGHTRAFSMHKLASVSGTELNLVTRMEATHVNSGFRCWLPVVSLMSWISVISVTKPCIFQHSHGLTSIRSHPHTMDWYRNMLFVL